MGVGDFQAKEQKRQMMTVDIDFQVPFPRFRFVPVRLNSQLQLLESHVCVHLSVFVLACSRLYCCLSSCQSALRPFCLRGYWVFSLCLPAATLRESAGAELGDFHPQRPEEDISPPLFASSPAAAALKVTDTTSRSIIVPVMVTWGRGNQVPKEWEQVCRYLYLRVSERDVLVLDTLSLRSTNRELRKGKKKVSAEREQGRVLWERMK